MTQEIQKQNKGDIVGSKNSLKAVMESPDFKESVKSVAGKYLTADHIVKAALLAVSRQPKLMGCTKASFLQSVIKAAELGLDFAGQTGQGYLIPFGKDCTFIPGYQGFIEIAYRSNRVNYIDAQLVYEKDECRYNLGSEPYIHHVPSMEADRGKVLFGYAIVRLKGSDFPKIELMSYDDIMKIKARSRAKDSGPWKTDEPEMMRKTVLRRVFKYIPKTPEISSALEYDNNLYDLQIEPLKDDKSNLGAAGLRTRMKVESTEVKPKRKRGRPRKDKPDTQAKDIKEFTNPEPEPQPESNEPKKYKCKDAFNADCGVVLEAESVEKNTDGELVCPHCESLVEEME